MPTDSKAKPQTDPAADRHLEQLKARAERLKHKIDVRISTFSEATRQDAMERAQKHWGQLQAEIKKASKA